MMTKKPAVLQLLVLFRHFSILLSFSSDLIILHFQCFTDFFQKKCKNIWSGYENAVLLQPLLREIE